MSDIELIRSFLRGDPAQVNLIRQWIMEVVHARVWIHGISAEDIVSDTIEKLLIALAEGRFRHESSLKTYVQRIARFTIVDSIRVHRRATEYCREARYESDGIVAPEDPFEKDEEVRLYMKVLSIVGEDCRNLWQMIFKESLTYAEIGRKLRISIGAVKTRAFRCRKRAVEISEKLG